MKTVIDMAREAGLSETSYNPPTWSGTPEAIERLSALIRAERDKELLEVAGEPVGYWHQAEDPDECDFYFADAINGDCPDCQPCYTAEALAAAVARAKDVPMKYKRMAFNAELQQRITDLESQLAAAHQDAEVDLAIIRKWPEGFQARLQHVWLDVVSFIPNVKLYDLQRVLAEFGFTMKVYEEAIDAAIKESK